MISVHNGSSVGSAVHYFSVDNYYTKDEGLAHSEWYGEGAKSLGLVGEIEEKDFSSLLDGQIGKQVLGRRVTNEKGEKVREHRPYTDVTFSAPKSVSLLAEVGGMQELRQAHEAAVKETLDYMQRSIAGTRVGYGKETMIEKTGNLTVALFRHNTSRELDPQTHTHAVVMNATQGRDGKWRSLFNDPIYDQQHTLGAIYMSTLAVKVRELGLDIEIKDKYGNFEIKGVGEEALEHFSQRRAQMKEAMAARGIDISSASADQREKAALVTRKSKTDVDHDLLLADWKERAKSVGLNLEGAIAQARERQDKSVNLPAKDSELNGVGVSRIPEQVPARHAEAETQGKEAGVPRVGPEMARPSEVHEPREPGLPRKPESLHGMPNETKNHGNDVNITKAEPESAGEGLQRSRDGRDNSRPSPNEDAPSQSQAEPPKSDPALEALRFAAAHLHEREMVVPSDLLLRTATQHSVGQASFLQIEATYNRLVENGTLLEVAEGGVTTNRLLQREEWLVYSIQEGRGKAQEILSPEKIQERIALYEEVERQRLNAPDFALTLGQRDSVALALSVNDRAVAVQGDAGTGKTTMLQAVRVMAEEQGYLVRGMSVSGSAAGTLEVETGIQSHTVKMFLIKEQQAQKEIEALKAAGQEIHRGKEMWVVDESSFIGQRDMNHIMRLAEKAEAKVVFVGDVRQLSSPEAGKPFELGQKEGMQTAQMREIRRQKTEDLRGVVSDIVRRQNTKAFEKLQAAGMVHEEKNKDGLISAVVRSYMADRENTLIITPFNRDRAEINGQVREELRSAGVLQGVDQNARILVNKGLTKAEAQHAKYYDANDIVLFRRGYKSLDVPDNSYLSVKGIDRDNNVLTLVATDGREVRFSPKGKSAMEVYREESRKLAVGDKLRITRSSAELKTGDMGVVKEIRGDNFTLDTGRKEVVLSAKDSPHWDHAYAVTVHASQGLTVDRTIFHIHAPKEGNREGDKKPLHEISKVFGEQSFYVGVTRSRYAVEVHTNDADAAKQYITATQEKTSSLEAVRALEDQQVRGRGGKEM